MASCCDARDAHTSWVSYADRLAYWVTNVISSERVSTSTLSYRHYISIHTSIISMSCHEERAIHGVGAEYLSQLTHKHKLLLDVSIYGKTSTSTSSRRHKYIRLISGGESAQSRRYTDARVYLHSCAIDRGLRWFMKLIRHEKSISSHSAIINLRYIHILMLLIQSTLTIITHTSC